ncbi:NTPase [Helicobacter apodemus]|uniref:NTPase n=1 Tax=Helicobacter apodemus TaxID=135569 RepID=A0A2U8FFW9_9HELI|nr:NTPase [Helicobacter apodemus]AWI35152.1 NTPase [Helicobacter apodemus]
MEKIYSYKIKVTDVSKLNDHYKEAIQEGTYEDEDIDKFFNTIKTFDVAESLLKKDFSNQFIEFEIITDTENIPLKVRLGDKNFQKGIQHLINLGSSKINKENINPQVEKEINKQLDGYKPKTYDKMLDGTFNALKNLSEIANKDLGLMILEFSDSFLKARENHQQNPEKESFFKQKMNEFFKKKLNKKQFDKEITTNKTLSMNR